MARKASSTPVIGLPTSVAARLAATSCASDGAGTGSASTQTASAAVTAMAASAASDVDCAAGPLGPRRGFRVAQARGGADQQRAGQAAADRGLGQRHVDAVEPHPHQRQQQAIGKEAGHRGERARATTIQSAERDDQQRERRRPADIMVASRRRRCARAISCDATAPERSTSSQTTTSLHRGEHAVDARQQAQDHQPQAQVVGLGQRVQPRERIREAQQARGSREKEERAAGHGDDGEEIERGPHARSSAAGSASGRPARPP